MTRSIFKHVFLTGTILILVCSGFTGLPTVQTKDNHPTKISIVIDSDNGVDDAVAIAYLLTRSDLVNILGITAVAGNTTVENAANNALLLLDTAQRTDIPVVVGAAAPLVLPANHEGMLVHGPDGLWFTGMQHPHDLSGLSHDAAGFICSKAQTGVTLLALGPLTNVANAVQACPAQMKLYKIVWLGGAKTVNGEGTTPVSVFNPWFDPDAVKIVLESGVSLSMVTTDAARSVQIDVTMFDKMAQKGNALGKLLAPALKQYASLPGRTASLNGKPSVGLCDPVAAVLAVHPDWATPQTGLVTVVTPDGPTRGLTIMAFSLSEHIGLLASGAEMSAIADKVYSDPNFNFNAALGAILYRKSDNAQVILTVDRKQILKEWLTGVMH